MKRPDVRIKSSREIAALESDGSRAVFTALIVTGPAPERMNVRGVRVDFSDTGWNRTVFVDESKLQPLKDIADWLTSDIERTGVDLGPGEGLAYLGSCEFRDHPDYYPLHFDYCYSGFCSPGLRFSSPTRILFARRKPSDLAAILGASIEYLKTEYLKTEYLKTR